MRISFKRSVTVVVATAAVLFGLSGLVKAAEDRATTGTSTLAGAAEQYHLRLHHLHTGESIDVVYRVGDTYVPAGLDKLNHFLRDHRTQDVSSYDPKEFDVLHALMAKLGKPNGVIDIVCGYRTPWSNAFLRQGRASSGVAEHSQHMLAKAIDIRVPGVATTTLRDAALSLHAGGVGYYPVNEFVHVDVGPVRQWSYGLASHRAVAHDSVRPARWSGRGATAGE
ncbi:uncharacterized protein YcbK (DUF882 family) [Edaphobacter aggregans]|uniref:Murein endopeptidase K n=1 Tax=Edaphobacter aggregans TaxID=570835 RepID=A0A428MIQ6_9BACT|nr:DUF882 domain-containing protein [Edaphobacter aggregans]RSL16719.1 uncharacterized protein YcbK (DUF882 family) [Edaphobacter aggregans]